MQLLLPIVLLAALALTLAMCTPLTAASTKYQALLLQWPLAKHVGWNFTTDVCSWPKVTCTAGELTGLLLDQAGLTGPLPEAWSQLNEVCRQYLCKHMQGTATFEIIYFVSLELPYIHCDSCTAHVAYM